MILRNLNLVLPISRHLTVFDLLQIFLTYHVGDKLDTIKTAAKKYTFDYKSIHFLRSIISSGRGNCIRAVVIDDQKYR